MSEVSLLQWANSLRLNMASDPGRQLFQEQVQLHGFLFLDDYLENIISGAKKDPLIEFVKTPGRKKAIAKKPKLIPSKMTSIVSLSLEDDGNKENTGPINAFHEVLLRAKETQQFPANKAGPFPSTKDYGGFAESAQRSMQRPLGPRLMQSQTENVPLESQIPTPLVTVYSPPQGAEMQINTMLHAADLALISPMEQNELSVIAEGDESAERSLAFIQPMQPADVPIHSEPSHLEGHKDTPTHGSSSSNPVAGEDPCEDPNITSTSSVNTFHSIPLNSPNAQPIPKSSSQIQSPLFTPVDVSTEDLNSQTFGSKLSPDQHSKPLPEIPGIFPRNKSFAGAEVIMPLPLASELSTTKTMTYDAPLRDPDLASTHGLKHKTSFSLFPTLPEPMPLRKSMRAPRDPSTGPAPLPTTTPGAAIGGKRTSWLAKAREVKALEGTAKKFASFGSLALHTVQAPAASGPSNVKRKSVDLLFDPHGTGLETEERRSKAVKSLDDDIAPLKAKADRTKGGENLAINAVAVECPPATSVVPMPLPSIPTEDGVLDRLRKTMEGLGARTGKSTGKSLGGFAAVNALAEARAAAEVRVAERNHKHDEMTIVMSLAPPDYIMDTNAVAEPSPVMVPKKDTVAVHEQPLNVSDLFPTEGHVKEKHRSPEKPFQFTPAFDHANLSKQTDNRDSISTTPPNSPPITRSNSFVLPSGPVFNKPPPVFVPPALIDKANTAAGDHSFKLPPSSTFSVPVPMSLGISPRLPSPSSSKPVASLTAHSTIESLKSDTVFDDDDDMPAWMPSTQDTDPTTGFNSQSQSHSQKMASLDEDDSWPLDEKIAEGVHWTFGTKEDSMTWSTLPSQSQRAEIGTMSGQLGPSIGQETRVREETQTSQLVPGAFDVDMDDEGNANDLLAHDTELEEMVLGSKSTVSLVEPKVTRSQSQMSMASSSSSQSQVGFFSQATKLLSSALGTSKKGKPEVKKVLQMAAVAAKRQQEEADKKAARLREMENRRQLANQRKAEEEKVRLQEEERKLKEEGERRKREREEHTDKRPLLKATGSKKEEDTTKKRKIEVEKKPDPKKLTTTATTKPPIKSALKQPSALGPSAAYNTSLQYTATSSNPNLKAVDIPKPAKAAPTSIQKGKGKALLSKAPVVHEDDTAQPSQIVQTQMAARAKAQLQAAKQIEPVMLSENIELPDINSEYSDSEDEDRPRTFDPPNWAQSPELRQALQIQSTINPDDIFGAVRPLRMEEIFRSRTNRFRARTSSANWTGADRLTLEEEREYARRMGFR